MRCSRGVTSWKFRSLIRLRLSLFGSNHKSTFPQRRRRLAVPVPRTLSSRVPPDMTAEARKCLMISLLTACSHASLRSGVVSPGHRSALSIYSFLQVLIAQAVPRRDSAIRFRSSGVEAESANRTSKFLALFSSFGPPSPVIRLIDRLRIERDRPREAKASRR